MVKFWAKQRGEILLSYYWIGGETGGGCAERGRSTSGCKG